MRTAMWVIFVLATFGLVAETKEKCPAPRKDDLGNNIFTCVSKKDVGQCKDTCTVETKTQDPPLPIAAPPPPVDEEKRGIAATKEEVAKWGNFTVYSNQVYTLRPASLPYARLTFVEQQSPFCPGQGDKIYVLSTQSVRSSTSEDGLFVFRERQHPRFKKDWTMVPLGAPEYEMTYDADVTSVYCNMTMNRQPYFFHFTTDYKGGQDVGFTLAPVTDKRNTFRLKWTSPQDLQACCSFVPDITAGLRLYDCPLSNSQNGCPQPKSIYFTDFIIEPALVEIKATMKNFEFEKSVDDMIFGATKSAHELAAVSVLENDASEDLKESVTASRVYTETLRYDILLSSSSGGTIQTDHKLTVSTSLSADAFGFASSNVAFGMTVKSGGKWTTNESEKHKNSSAVTRSKAYSTSYVVTVPKFTRVNYSAFVDFTDDAEMTYKADLQLTAKYILLGQDNTAHREDAPAESLRDYLKRVAPEVTVKHLQGRKVVAGVEGKVSATLGVNTYWKISDPTPTRD